MTKNINEFIKELTDYINTNIVGTDNTHITKCVPLDNVTNRGHAILIQVEVPENINEEFQNFGPVYYAEELMREYSQFPIAIIGELINVDVDDFYYELIDMLSNQIKTADMTLDDYEKEDIIITALPAEQVSKQNKEAFVTKELLGLTLTMKGRICNSISNDGQSYFMPISTKDGRKSTETDWCIAEQNSIRETNIEFDCIPVMHISMLSDEDKPKPVPVCGQITDTNKFYDYFYLISARLVWSEIAQIMKADKIYIIPNGAYSAKFIADGVDIRTNDAASDTCMTFAKEAVKTCNMGTMPIFVYNCSTTKIAKLERND